MSHARKPYPSDVIDDEWSLVVPYLTLTREDAQQREHALREPFSWATRRGRLVEDYKRYASTLAGFHVVAFACLMLSQTAGLMQSA